MTVTVGNVSTIGNATNNARTVWLYSTDTYATITTAGYLNSNLVGFQVNVGDFFEIVYNSGANQGGFIPSIASNGTVTLSAATNPTVLTSTILNPDAGANLVPFSVTVGHAALASAGTVTLYASSGTKQYVPLILNENKGGTNFSGGDRLLAITDGTTVYSVIPATNIETLVNSGYGISTPMPFPASAAIYTPTVAGASLVAEYSGGSADHTAGSVVLSGLLWRVA